MKGGGEHAARGLLARSSARRRRSWPAARTLNVGARISRAGARSVASRYAMRWVSVRVVRLPGPARISSGPGP